MILGNLLCSGVQRLTDSPDLKTSQACVQGTRCLLEIKWGSVFHVTKVPFIEVKAQIHATINGVSVDDERVNLPGVLETKCTCKQGCCCGAMSNGLCWILCFLPEIDLWKGLIEIRNGKL